MMELRDKLIVSANDGNKGPFPDEYHKGYSDALKSIANDIDVQMMEKEKNMVINVWWNGHDERGRAGMIHVPESAPEDYYNEMFEK